MPAPKRQGLSSDLRSGIQSRSSATPLWAVMVLAAILSTGCTTPFLPELPALPDTSGLDIMSPKMLTPAPKIARYTNGDGSAATMLPSDGSMSMEAYQRIRQAKEQNAVVLQVEGDEAPIRVLPLPGEDQSVFVSELLTQTGLIKKFGNVNATVFRASADSIAGIRMEVNFKGDGQIDPVTDYALRAGDRVHVRKKRAISGMQSLVNMALKR